MRERFSILRPPDLHLVGGTIWGAKVLVILSNMNEALDALQAFRNRGWNGVTGAAELVRPHLFGVIFTDRLDLTQELSRRLHPNPRLSSPDEGILTLLVEDEDACLTAAYDAGADWVVRRPLNLEDPICIHKMMDGG